MILEGLVTTHGPDGSVNLAPMGPIVAPDLSSFVLRPFQTSTTYRNLRETRAGVLHVTDDVLLIAQAALNRLPAIPVMRPAERVVGSVLVDCCRWFEFAVESIDDRSERTEIAARVVHTGRTRDFFGFNRAKHAVLEATILATRLHLLPRESVAADLERLRPLVEKTAGPQEQAAWDLVCRVIAEGTASP